MMMRTGIILFLWVLASAPGCLVTFDRDFDFDGDGVPGSLDCDDEAAEQAPGLEEVCADEIDQDCDGIDPTCPPGDTNSNEGAQEEATPEADQDDGSAGEEEGVTSTGNGNGRGNGNGNGQGNGNSGGKE